MRAILEKTARRGNSPPSFAKRVSRECKTYKFKVWQSREARKRRIFLGFIGQILEETRVVVTPENGFSAVRKRNTRFSLAVNTERLQKALDQLQKLRV